MSGSSARPLAVFDLDGTITITDTLLPYLASVDPVRTARYAPGSVRTALRDAARRDAAKEELIASVLAGRSLEEASARGERFVSGRLRRLLRADMVSRLRWHQREGHATVLLTAAPQLIALPTARSLGFDAVLCTRVVEELGRWRFDGPNMRGPVKLAAIQAFAASPVPSSVYAYGDSDDDLPVLEWCHHPYRIGERRRR